MTDHDRQPSAPVPSRPLSEKGHHGETATAERLVMNRTGSFEWDLDAHTLDIDDAGLLVFGLDPLEVLPEPTRRVRLSVQDRSSVWPRRRSPGETATSGRGLLLLDAVTTRWGVEPRGEGKAVWCEIGPSTPPDSARPRPAERA